CREQYGLHMLSQPIHELLHRGLLTLDGFHELKLRATAIEVVVRAMDAEVGVAAQIVGEEADANGEGDEPAGEGDERALRPGQERPGAFEIPARERLEHGQ